ncbi:Alpha/Beta hydrolase protein [Echria macrotheca]|uniref:Alpha/Beta hydrolase protein n=1 Tax=Echria macrotheca TaxID=438768 RepID=A0AAJ0B106_9PEZI|nr:Alpha/Beta hydrolase protein [Echria macrotheca]
MLYESRGDFQRLPDTIMDEKRLLGDMSSYLAGEVPRQPPRKQRRLVPSLRCLVAGVLSGLAILYFVLSGCGVFRHCPHHYDNRQYLTYEGEHIQWEICGDVKGRPLECSSIDVPMDQFNTHDIGTKTFSIPLIRLRGKNATQNILLNPGGPGGSGLDFLRLVGDQIATIIGEGLHLLTFDPRGVGASRPLASCYPDDETRRGLSSKLDGKLIENSGEIYAWTAGFVQGCADTMGDYGKYLNTPQVAADMNSILDAVGQEDMVYWGLSYGSLLGQTYATLFPDRSRRVVIDGVTNQFDWYDGRIITEYLTDTENVLEGFLDECIAAGDKKCALASINDTKKELSKTLFSFLEKLKEEPIGVYVNNTVYGVLDYGKIMYNGIFPALYKPANWPLLADRLAQLIQGNTTEAFLAYGRADAWGVNIDGGRFVTLNDGLSGPQYWKQGRKALLEEMLPLSNLSLFIGMQWDAFYARQQWAVPRTHAYRPRRGIETVHPLLILSTTYDPICPLISARSANDAFLGSRIVEIKGYGHCSVSLSSMCLVKRLREFLYEGKVPDGNTQCEVDSPYFVKPEEDGQVVAQTYFGDPEEQRIHLAQLQLARDWDWSRW